jgi:hypothetical protein
MLHAASGFIKWLYYSRDLVYREKKPDKYMKRSPEEVERMLDDLFGGKHLVKKTSEDWEALAMISSAAQIWAIVCTEATNCPLHLHSSIHLSTNIA